MDETKHTVTGQDSRPHHRSKFMQQLIAYIETLILEEGPLPEGVRCYVDYRVLTEEQKAHRQRCLELWEKVAVTDIEEGREAARAVLSVFLKEFGVYMKSLPLTQTPQEPPGRAEEG